MLDDKLQVTYANPAAETLFAHGRKHLIGASFDRALPGSAGLMERLRQAVDEEAGRLQSLLTRLLTPSRLPRVEPLNIHEVLERVRTLLTAEFPNIEIVRDYDTSLPDLAGDKEQLIQAILNVTRNAAQAISARGEIRITTRIARH